MVANLDTAFFGSHWRLRPLLRTGVYDCKDLWLPTNYEELRNETLRVVKTTWWGPTELNPDNVSSLDDILQKGYTLVSSNYERRDSNLRDWLTTWKHALHASYSWANIYVTPAGAKGFPRHKDTSEGFLVQLAGSKIWSLYGTDARKKAVETVTVNAGDTLYIPAGWYHSAEASVLGSTHLTICFEWSQK